MVFCYPFLLYLTRLMGLEFKWIRLTKSYYFYHAHLLLFGQHYTEISFTSIKWANVNEMDIRKLTLSPLTHWGRDKMAAMFADGTLKPIFLNENIRISIKIWLKIVPKVPINNIPELVQIMAWRRPMMVRLPTLISVTRLQWVNICA